MQECCLGRVIIPNVFFVGEDVKLAAQSRCGPAPDGHRYYSRNPLHVNPAHASPHPLDTPESPKPAPEHPNSTHPPPPQRPSQHLDNHTSVPSASAAERTTSATICEGMAELAAGSIVPAAATQVRRTPQNGRYRSFMLHEGDPRGAAEASRRCGRDGEPPRVRGDVAVAEQAGSGAGEADSAGRVRDSLQGADTSNSESAGAAMAQNLLSRALAGSGSADEQGGSGADAGRGGERSCRSPAGEGRASDLGGHVDAGGVSSNGVRREIGSGEDRSNGVTPHRPCNHTELQEAASVDDWQASSAQLRRDPAAGRLASRHCNGSPSEGAAQLAPASAREGRICEAEASQGGWSRDLMRDGQQAVDFQESPGMDASENMADLMQQVCSVALIGRIVKRET